LSKLDDIVQIEITRDEPFEYKAKVIVGYDHQLFLNRLLDLGEQYLEDNKIWAILFDPTPDDNMLSDLRDYKEILYKFTNYPRLFGKAFYLGHHKKEDHMRVIDHVLSTFLQDYEIVEFIGDIDVN
jgi:hypothetical protein